MNCDLKIFGKIDYSCQAQIDAICALPPFENQRIRIMPDAHSGKNAVVGFTSTYTDKIIPNIIGGDIGCGVLAVKFKKPKKGLDFHKLDKTICSIIPYGVGNINNIPVDTFNFERLKCWQNLPSKNNIPKALSSLGAGNHFIAINKDNNNNFWLVIHTGSRNLGTQIAQYYQDLAGNRIDKDLDSSIPYAMAWIENKNYEDYLADMNIALEFAKQNRFLIAKNIAKEYGFKLTEDIVESIHNYIDTDNMIIRKGAISAQENEPVIIPLNMAEGCIVGIGKGNQDWNFSAPHGAGRLLTRTDAKNSLSVSEYKQSMKNTWSCCVGADTIDESPMAYKPSQEIIENISDCMVITDKLSEVYNFKAPTKE